MIILLEGSMIILAKPDSVYVNKNYKRKGVIALLSKII